MCFLESERLILRKMGLADFKEISKILKNPDVMYAWEYSFSDEDVYSWISKNMACYEQYNLGYFIAIEKKSGNVIGQIALMPDVVAGKNVHEIGYILNSPYQGKGYAQESASLLVEYAFNVLKLESVIFEIRPLNVQSRNVAEKLGAKIDGSFIKKVRGKNMEHLIYRLSYVH